MAIVKINALEIPPQAGEEIVKRFTARLEELAKVDGFEGFELLRPTGETEPRWFVYSRWADEAAYEAWRESGAHPGREGGGHPGGQPGGAEGEEAPQRPLARGATLLEFEVAVAAGPDESA